MHEVSALCCKEIVGMVSAVLLSLLYCFIFFTLKKLECLKQDNLCPLNIIAWDDRKRQISFFWF